MRVSNPSSNRPFPRPAAILILLTAVPTPSIIPSIIFSKLDSSGFIGPTVIPKVERNSYSSVSKARYRSAFLNKSVISIRLVFNCSRNCPLMRLLFCLEFPSRSSFPYQLIILDFGIVILSSRLSLGVSSDIAIFGSRVPASFIFFKAETK